MSESGELEEDSFVLDELGLAEDMAVELVWGVDAEEEASETLLSELRRLAAAVADESTLVGDRSQSDSSRVAVDDEEEHAVEGLGGV